ncbi:MAG: hypothetical protein OXH94_01115 [Rhodospirillales bacterium]|nr:hypothetical protein [Rhodospirillales bacterium]
MTGERSIWRSIQRHRFKILIAAVVVYFGVSLIYDFDETLSIIVASVLAMLFIGAPLAVIGEILKWCFRKIRGEEPERPEPPQT